MTTQSVATPDPGETSPRPLRKDAARNRELLLQAAREVFEQRGLDATLDDIARHAGLGVGTAYRHFANKHELVTALAVTRIDAFIADALAALSQEDPWQALVGFFEISAVAQSSNRYLHQIMMGTHEADHSERIRTTFIQPITDVIDRCKQAGIVRDDIEATDIPVIFAMLSVAFVVQPPSSPQMWRRYLALLIDGLRATDRPPLPVPAMDVSEIDAAMIAMKKGV